MRKRLLFVIPYMHEGGAERALSNIQCHMPHEYELYTLINSDIDRVYPNVGNVISLHIDRSASTESVLFQFYALIKRTRLLLKLKKYGNYHACISFIDSANIANILSGRRYCKVIVSSRISYSFNNSRPQYRFIVKPLVRLLYGKADKVVAVSKELKNELEEDFKIPSSRLITITNGYDVDGINSLARIVISESVNTLKKNHRLVLTVGRLSNQKHQWHLIRAFNRVIESVPNALLLIAGTGELETQLKHLVRILNLTGKVIFIGFADNIYQYMNIADIFVLPSGYEGFPNALAEAVCVGTPCIATDFRTGAREILAPGRLFDGRSIERVTECEYGILTPVCSGTMYKGDDPLEPQEIELAKAMVQMLIDGELNRRYREKSIERSKTLDIQSVVDRWIRVVEE